MQRSTLVKSDRWIRRMITHDSVPFAPTSYIDYAMRVIGRGEVTKRPVNAGPTAKKKAEASTVPSAGMNTSAPAGEGGPSSGDDDDGDGDGEADGPQHSARSRCHCIPCFSSCSPRAPRRPKFCFPLTRRACAWLIAFGLLLAYVVQPSFALVFIQLGHKELASEVLKYRPQLPSLDWHMGRSPSE